LQPLNWVRRAAYGGVAAITATVGLAGMTATAAHAAVTTTTIAGADRYQTSAMVAETKFPSGVTSGNVILATGLNYPDALAGNYFAGQTTAPVLLTTATASDPAFNATVMPALAKLLPAATKKVTILGGTAAVGADVQSALTSAGYTVTRIGGATRYDTAQMVDTQSGQTPGNGTSGKVTCIVATGQNFADALAAGPLSWNKHFPIVLTDGTQSTLGSQATATISADGCKDFLIMGGSAAISSGISSQLATLGTVDKQFAGADRYDTAAQIASYEVSTYGFNASKLFLVSGVNFPDALSAGPLAGDPGPLVEDNGTTVTSGPATNECAAGGSNATITQVGGSAANGTGSLSACQSAAGAATSNTYTLSGGSLTLSASNASAPTQGVTTYTVTGLPTSTPVNVALFPLAGTACTDGAGNTTGGPTSSGTFTPPGCAGTTPTAGTVSGEGATLVNPGGALGGVNAGFAKPSAGGVAGSPASEKDTAYIASVNGVPTTLNGAGDGPTILYGLSASSGSLTFVLNSFQGDAAIPVVYTAPSSAGSTPPLVANANGTPATGYSVGVGSASAWAAPPAPSLAAGNTYDVSVVLTPPLSGANTFDGLVLGCNGFGPCPVAGTVGNIFAFTFNTSGDSYNYSDATPIPLASFSSYLSAAVAGEKVPNTNTIFDPGNNGGAGGVNGDTLTVGGASGYSSGTPTTLSFLADVPAPATAVNGTNNGCAFTAGGPPATCQAANVITWTAPVNPDVSGSQAVPGGTALAGNAKYLIFRTTDTSGTLGSPTQVGAVTVSPSTTVNNGDGQAAAGCNASNAACTNVSAPEFIDVGPLVAGQQYVYWVVPEAAGAGAPGDGPFSTASGAVTAGSASTITTPVIDSITVVGGTAAGGTPVAGGYAYPANTGLLQVTYNEAVTCLNAAGADFTYTNSNGSPHPITGASCSPAPAGNYNGAAADNSARTLIIGMSPQSGSTPTFSANTVAPPASGDFVTYTAPGSSNTSNAVYAGPVGTPTFAASQTVTDNANPTAVSRTGTDTSPSNPLI